MNSTATIINDQTSPEISGLQEQLQILQDTLKSLRNTESEETLHKMELEVDRLQRLILMRNKLK